MRPSVALLGSSLLVLCALCGACKPRTESTASPDAAAPSTQPSTQASIAPSSKASAWASASAITGASGYGPKEAGVVELPVACAVAYATYPAGNGPKPGDDLSDAAVPMRVPAGATLTLSIRKSGHELAIAGPAVFRPCTRAEPDVVLIASGHTRTEGSVSIRPGTELYVATPAGVAIIGRATLELAVGPMSTAWQLVEGDASFTDLDAPKSLKPGDKGTGKRFSDGGLLLTRCGVQAASVANTEHLLLGQGQGIDGGAPLPAASIGILTAESIKHAREKVLDCGFAEAFGLSCDVLTKEGTPKDKAESGCKGGYDVVLAYIAKVSAPGTLPPGVPHAP